MSERYHEPRATLLHWPWRLFCRRWIRLIEFAAEEQARRAELENEREIAKLQRVHQQRLGG